MGMERCVPSGLPPVFQEAIHVDVGQHWANHPTLRRAAGAMPTAAHASLAITITFLDRCLEPQFDEAQHIAVHDTPGNRFEKLRVRDRIEILG